MGWSRGRQGTPIPAAHPPTAPPRSASPRSPPSPTASVQPAIWPDVAPWVCPAVERPVLPSVTPAGPPLIAGMFTGKFCKQANSTWTRRYMHTQRQWHPQNIFLCLLTFGSKKSQTLKGPWHQTFPHLCNDHLLNPRTTLLCV